MKNYRVDSSFAQENENPFYYVLADYAEVSPAGVLTFFKKAPPQSYQEPSVVQVFGVGGWITYSEVN